MFDPIREIDSRWETEKRWVKGREQKSSTDVSTKKLTMAIVTEGHDKPILNFRGGPTGFESYYIEDLSLSSDEGDFCICAGTANRWPACFVDKAEVNKFVEEYRATIEVS